MYIYLIQSTFMLSMLMVSLAEKLHHTDTSQSNNHIFSFIPPSPDLEAIPDSEDSLSNTFMPPPPNSAALSQHFIPPSPDVPQIISSVKAHFSFGTSEYYFSWFHNKKQYTYSEAYRFCHNLSGDWYVVSIESLQEDQLIDNIIEHYKLRFIWIGAVKQSGIYRLWDSGEKFEGLNFSHTGRFRTPQPDNAEPPAENCLAILDKFYPNDGVTWHDVACHHKKVTICERPRIR